MINQRTTGALVLAASMAALGATGYTSVRAAAFARCQAHYNEITNDRLRILTDVGASERTAQRARDDALDATFLDPSLLKPVEKRTPAEQQRVRDLFAAYLHAAEALKIERAKADAARRDNPLPPPPSQVC